MAKLLHVETRNLFNVFINAQIVRPSVFLGFGWAVFDKADSFNSSYLMSWHVMSCHDMACHVMARHDMS